MTIVHGKIESLKHLKLQLNQRGITQFNSIGELYDFNKSYQVEKLSIENRVSEEYKQQLSILKSEKKLIQEEIDQEKRQKICTLLQVLHRLKFKYEEIKSKSKSNSLTELIYWYWEQILKYRITHLEQNFDYQLERSMDNSSKKLILINEKIERFVSDKENFVNELKNSKRQKLDHIKATLEELYPLIAGAIGESKVVQELKDLVGNNILINDYYKEFSPPVFNQKEGERIYSIQIDHLLVTDAGVFNIETKNWSKKSVENLDMRSPVQQVKRNGYALWVQLNSDSRYSDFYLDSHHWGRKEIPIYNLVVMINHKPLGKFKFVHIKTLKEIKSFISKFEKVLHEHEVQQISEYFIRSNDRKSEYWSVEADVQSDLSN